MSAISHHATIDALTLSSEEGRGDAQLMRIFCERTMDGVGRCIIAIAPGSYQAPKLQSDVSLSLDIGNGSHAVFTGIVAGVAASATATRIEAYDRLYALGRMEFARVFENISAGDIVGELLKHCDAQPGAIETGPSFPSFALHPGPSALSHLRRLAALCGWDVFCDGKGRVNVCGPATKGNEHVFPAGEQVLSLDLHRAVPPREGVEVWGEGAASTKGASRSHWLATELEAVSARATVTPVGEVQVDKKTKTAARSRHGVLRSGELATATVKAIARAQAARRIRGELTVAGAPQVHPGDQIRIDQLPPEHSAEALLRGVTLRARSVSHYLAAASGFRTRMEF